MVVQFFDQPILNTPYAYPSRHWELDDDGQPTNRIIEIRRRSELITPVPKPRKRRRGKDLFRAVSGRSCTNHLALPPYPGACSGAKVLCLDDTVN